MKRAAQSARAPRERARRWTAMGMATRIVVAEDESHRASRRRRYVRVGGERVSARRHRRARRRRVAVAFAFAFAC